MNMIVDPGRALFAKRQRALSDSLLNKANAMGAQPMNHWAQGLNQLSASLVGNHLGKRASAEEAAIAKERQGRLTQMLTSPAGINPAAVAQFDPSMGLQMAIDSQKPPELPGIGQEYEYARPRLRRLI